MNQSFYVYNAKTLLTTPLYHSLEQDIIQYHVHFVINVKIIIVNNTSFRVLIRILLLGNLKGIDYFYDFILNCIIFRLVVNTETTFPQSLEYKNQFESTFFQQFAIENVSTNFMHKLHADL